MEEGGGERAIETETETGTGGAGGANAISTAEVEMKGVSSVFLSRAESGKDAPTTHKPLT